jgi:hypothetical protein
MADQKISELTALTGANVADDDAIAIVDTSATETKKIVFSELKNALDTATGFVRITGDTMTGNLSMGDNVKAIFGAGSDLQIYHDGSNSYISDQGTGQLRLLASQFQVMNAAGTESMVFGAQDNTATLYYDNAPKLATTDTGVDITGNTLSDSLTANGSLNGLIAGSVMLDYSGSSTSRLLAVGADATTAGILKVVSTASDGGPYIEAMTISSTGVDITGTLTSDGLTVDGNVAIGLASTNTWSTGYAIEIGTEQAAIWGAGDQIDITGNAYFNSGWKAAATKGGASKYEQALGSHNFAVSGSVTADSAITFKQALNIANNGDISFYEDTGTTAKFFWDASLEALGVGITPSTAMHVYSASGNTALRVETGLTNGQAQINFKNDARRYNVGINSSDNLVFEDDTAGLTRMIIDSSGNVGIGTSSPSSKLHVSGTYDTILDGNSVQFTRAGPSYIQNNTAGGYTVFQQASGEVMRIDSSGNVGIGTSSPSNKLHVKSAGSGTVALFGDSIGNNEIAVTRITTNPGYTSLKSTTSKGSVLGGPILTFGTVNADGSSEVERMRIDSSGNLLVGKTVADTTTLGNIVYAGIVSATMSGDPAIFANRAQDGSVIEIQQSGSTVGSIAHNGRMTIYGTNGATGAGWYFGSQVLLPLDYTGTLADNTIDLGQHNIRFDDIYATNGTIQTSDRNEKQDIAELTDAEQRVAVAAKGLLRKFRWRDAVEAKGDEARTHFGIIAQDLQAAFAAEGLDAGDYAMFISSTWTDEETGEERTRMGVRYSELLAFIIAAI